VRIAHLCLSCFFVDGRSYQENELVKQHVRDGHDVIVIASTETHSSEGKLTYTEAQEYLGEEGARVVRLRYHPGIPHTLSRKLRVHSGVRQLLEDFRPDVILFHGACGWELLTAARYAREHPSTRLYVDSHEDWNNSARTFISRVILHRLYYRAILRRALPKVRRILCVSTESVEFVRDLYGVPPSMLEFYPLGGHPIADDEYWRRRRGVRRSYDISDDAILFVQSGKQTRRKKLIEGLQAFSRTQDARFRLLIVGSIYEEIREEAERLIEADCRVRYVGWKTADELTDLLCAADVYLQPGTQSVTMQHSLCARCAIILDDVPAHAVYHKNNGWLVKDNQSLVAAMHEAGSADLRSMQERSYQIACELLDYSLLAERVLE